MTTRQEVYHVIDGERDYQNRRWTKMHSLEEWYTYIENYMNEAKHILSRLPKQEADPQALHIMRKVAAMAVCAMEQHGAPQR